MRCVIPCGGASTRMNGKNKCLIDLAGKPLIAHVVDFWRDVGVEDFVFVVGGPDSPEVVANIYQIGLRVTTFVNRKNVVNLVGAIHLAKDHVGQRFVLALGDCLNVGVFLPQKVGNYGIGVCTVDGPELRKNYLVETDGTKITKLVEKPDTDVGLCGMGTLFLHREVFRYIEELDYLPLSTSVDLTGALQLMIDKGEEVLPVRFDGTYINITDPEDIKKAKEVVTT